MIWENKEKNLIVIKRMNQNNPYRAYWEKTQAKSLKLAMNNISTIILT